MDVKLSKRMQAVADMIQEKRVADIGCDHAFVSIYLAQRPQVESVIAMDVKKGPVSIARANVQAHNLTDRIQVRMSDGFDSLSVGEADVAVIAGMGGYLMIDILKRGMEHLKAGIHLVLQPQSDIKVVRKFLTDAGYMIQKESMLMEDEKYYTLFKAVPADGESIKYNELEYTWGPILIRDKNPVLYKYLNHAKLKNLELIQRLSLSESEKSRLRLGELEEENRLIESALSYY